MSGQSVIIEVSPSRLELAVLRGRSVVASRTRRFDATEWDRAWPDALAALTPILAQMVSELACAHAPATVLYTAPGSVSTIASCPATTPLGDARKAAALALTGLAEFALESNPFEINFLSDHAPANAQSTPESASPQRHALAVADTEERAAAIAAWVNSAGLRFTAMIPGEAVVQRDAARLCSRRDLAGAVCAVLWLGEHGSTLAVGRGGTLNFVRAIPVGLELLVDAVCRPLRARASDSTSHTLDRAGVREILRSIGIPRIDDAIPGHPDLSGASLLPLLQPTLQRLSVEIKQSVRFGVSEQDRASVQLQLAGPGAMVPSLTAALAALSGCRPAEESARPSESTDSSAVRGIIASFLLASRELPTLLPIAQRRDILTTRVRRALAGGLAAAAALLAFDSCITRAQLAAESAKLAALTHAQAAAAPASRAREAVASARSALAAVQQRIGAQLSSAPDFAAALRLLARATPAEIRLSSISFTRNAESASGRMSASIRAAAEQPTAPTIREYLDRLGDFPLFENVKLGLCQRAKVDGHPVQTFDFSLTPVAIPAASLAGIDGTGERPAVEASEAKR